MNIPVVPRLLLVFLFYLASTAMASADIQIGHNPIEESTAGERISMVAEIEDSDNEIQVVRVYIKLAGESRYRYATMNSGDGKEYTAVLPAPKSGVDSLEYFIFAKNDNSDVIKSQNITMLIEADAEVAAASQAVDATEFRAVDGYHGKIVRAQGDVMIVTANGEKRSLAEVGNVVLETETVETGANGRAAIDFDKDPFTVVDTNSQLRVKQLGFFAHLAGKAYFSFKKIFGVSSQPKIVSNLVASVGIRGTAFLSKAESGYAMKEGSVKVFPKDDQKSASLGEGRETTADADGKLVEGPITPESLAKIDELESFAGLLLAATIAQNTPSTTGTVATSAIGGIGVGTIAVAGLGTAAVVGGSSSSSSKGSSSSSSSSGGGDPGSTQCDDTSVSGSDEPVSQIVNLGQSSGTINVNFDAAYVKDQMQVFYEGSLVSDSGCYGDGLIFSDSFTYSGSDEFVTVQITPNCENPSGSGTFWQFTISCPN